MAIAEVTIFPVGTGTTSLSRYVAEAVKVLQNEKEVSSTPTAMGTIIEGDLNRIWEVVKRMHEAVVDAGALRVETIVRIDDRRDKPSSSRSKLESLRKASGQ